MYRIHTKYQAAAVPGQAKGRARAGPGPAAAARLGGGLEGFQALMDHNFFADINWDDLIGRSVCNL